MARARVFNRSAPRRRMTWEGAEINATATSGGAVVNTLVSEANLENVPNPTIVRIRGHVLVRQTAQGAAGTRGEAFMGIKLATGLAISAGIASIEKPFSDIGSDWIWWDVRAYGAGPNP